MPDVRLESISKTYGKVVAVDNIRISIADGEFTALVGPSGCGKTTTLRLIAGLEHVTSGDIYFGDRCVTHSAPRDRDVAVVFQNYSLYGHLNVRENLAFGLKARKVPQAQIYAAVESIAQLLKIEHLLQRRPHQLSGGERQRVAIGRALARKPNVFLFDEPLSSLDAALRLELRAEIIRLHQQFGNTTIYVTHDQAEAMSMADKLVVMDHGRILQSGPPLDVYRRPANTFVARFIGSPPMNIIPGEIVSSAGTLFLESDIGRHPLTNPAQVKYFMNKAKNGSQYLVGFRPEEITLSPTGLQSLSFGCEIAVVECLGAETLLLVRSREAEICIRTMEGRQFMRGEKITAYIDPTHIRLFNAGDGRAVATEISTPSL